MTIEEKMSIARGIVTPLLRKIGAGKYDRTIRCGQFVAWNVIKDSRNFAVMTLAVDF